jgi:hypothetical protein
LEPPSPFGPLFYSPISSLYLCPFFQHFLLHPLTACSVLGWNAAWNSPRDFVAQQLPTAPLIVPDAALLLSYSLGSIFLLLAGFAILCTVVTREKRITKGYLLVAAAGDLGHMLANYKAMGPAVFWNFNGYNEIMWGNVAVTAFLHVNRLATVLGVFGQF